MSKMLFVSALCLLSSLQLSGCATSSATRSTERPAPTLVSDAKMLSDGALAFDRLKNEMAVNHDPSLANYVRCIAGSLTLLAHQKLKTTNWEVVIFQSNDVNAFILPGGKIAVYTGLLKVATTADQLAAVLAHQLGHVLAHDESVRYSQQLPAQSAADAASVMLAVNGASQYGYALAYTRQQEADADAVGLILMAQAGFDPRAADTVWAKMMKRGRKQPAEILATHPVDQSRLEALQARLHEDLPVYESVAVKPHCTH